MKNYVFFVLVFLLASTGLQAELVTCDAPTGVQVQRHSDGQATLNAITSSGAVDIFVRPYDGSPPGEAQEPNHNLENLALPTTSEALLPQYHYHIWVRTNCGDGNHSEWTGPFLVHTYETCEDASDIVVERTGDTTASMSADGTNDFYIVPEGDPGPVDVWTQPNAFGGNDVASPYLRNDLDPLTSYDVYVRRQCNETQVTDWVGPYSLPAISVVGCPDPIMEDITTVRISNTSATIDGANPAYLYQGSANRAGRPLRAKAMYGMDAMAMPFTHNALVPMFDYDVWIRTICGEDDFSNWVGPFYVPVYAAPAEKVQLSPNPTTGPVKMEGSDIVNIQVFNMSGNLEMSSKVNNNEVNLQNLAPGQYIIQMIDAEGNVSSTKLMKR